MSATERVSRIEGTYMQHFQAADEQTIGCGGVEKIENRLPSGSHRHTFLEVQIPDRCDFDGRTSATSGYIC